MGLLRFELKSIAPEANKNECISPVNLDILQEFIDFRKIEGLSKRWIVTTRQYLTDYLEYVNWKIDKKKTLQYLNKIRDKQKTTSFRKIAYQIRKFLLYCDINWVNQLKLPKEPEASIKRVTLGDIYESIKKLQKRKDCERYLPVISRKLKAGTFHLYNFRHFSSL